MKKRKKARREEEPKEKKKRKTGIVKKKKKKLQYFDCFPCLLIYLFMEITVFFFILCENLLH